VNRRRALRRRVLVVLLLLVSIALLTLYFRESESGFAHRVQDTALRVVAPLQYGSARATQPFRDAWNWSADLFRAKSENERLRAELDELRAGVAQELVTQAENDELRALVEMQRKKVFPADVRLVAARVIARSTTAWYSSVTIDVGSAQGVRRYDAVINGEGLVGRVSRVTPRASQVMLITDQQSYVDAIVVPGSAQGILAGSVTGDLSLQYVDKKEEVEVGQYVTTSGLAGSLFLRGIPIGVVETVAVQDVDLYQSITVRPFADFRTLDIVSVVCR
jgi:rod shape-determining protein MreC